MTCGKVGFWHVAKLSNIWLNWHCYIFSLEVWQTHQHITLKNKYLYKEKVIKDRVMNIPLECQMAGGFCRNCLQEGEGERERERGREVVKWVFGWAIYKLFCKSKVSTNMIKQVLPSTNTNFSTTKKVPIQR